MFYLSNQSVFSSHSSVCVCDCVVYLWNDGEFGPQVVQADLRYLHLVDGDLSCCSFQQPEEAERHGGLPGPCTTHDTNLYRNTHTAVISDPCWPVAAYSSPHHTFPPSLPLWRSVWGSSGRGPVPLGTERCSRGTPRSPWWAIQVGASCPPPPRGPVNTNAAFLTRKTFWTTHQRVWLLAGLICLSLDKLWSSVCVCGVTQSCQTFISPLRHTGCSKQKLSLTALPAIRRGTYCDGCCWESTLCTVQVPCLSYVTEGPLLAPGNLTFLDLVIVYRCCVVREHDLAAGQFFGMWVNSYFLTAAQSRRYFTLESKHMLNPTSVGY